MGNQKMDKTEKLATFCTQDTGPRQTKLKHTTICKETQIT